MLILLEPYGQTSNQFIQHVSIDAFCRENNIRYYNPFFHNYLQEYPNLELRANNILIDKSIPLAYKLKRLKLAKVICFDDGKKHNDPAEYRSRLAYCYGWLFRSSEDVLKYRSNYQKQFIPNSQIKETGDKVLHALSDSKFTIGVHIRRGDYRDFRNGIYFYEDSVYISYIKQLIECLGCKCRIILFSNDRDLDCKLYENTFDNVYLSRHSVSTDHYMMSKCDYLIGPPSTFTSWASFVGDVKYYHIKDRNAPLSLQEFRVHTTF